MKLLFLARTLCRQTPFVSEPFREWQEFPVLAAFPSHIVREDGRYLGLAQQILFD
jgi:hypothetical protein